MINLRPEQPFALYELDAQSSGLTALNPSRLLQAVEDDILVGALPAELHPGTEHLGVTAVRSAVLSREIFLATLQPQRDGTVGMRIQVYPPVDHKGHIVQVPAGVVRADEPSLETLLVPSRRMPEDLRPQVIRVPPGHRAGLIES